MTRFFDTFLPRRKYSQIAATQCPRRAGAFTLVEMLTVVGIIGLLAAGIGVALSGGGNSAAAISNSQRMVSSMFQAARTNAVMKGQETAVIIYREGDKETDPNKFLRFIGIVYKDTADGDKWKPLNRGSYLPKGVYVVPSEKAGSIAFGKSPEFKSAAPKYSNVSIAFPIQIKDAPEDSWDMYSFDKNGNLMGGNAHLIFAPAEVKGPPKNGVPDIADSAVELVVGQIGGIALLRSGGALMLDDLDGVYTKLPAPKPSNDNND